MKKNVKNIVLSLGIVLLILSSACPWFNPSGSPTPPQPEQSEAPSRQIVFEGVIRSVVDNSPIAGAEVFFNGQVTISDMQGLFSFILNSNNTDCLRIKKSGYSVYSKPQSRISRSIKNLEILLKPVDYNTIIELDNPEGNIVSTLDGASISIPQISGEISEPLAVSLTSFNVSTEDINCVPGDFSALDSNGEDVQIISLGMLDVRVVGTQSGIEYSLEGLASYEIVIPITGDIEKATPIIPMWYYDEELGKWIEEGIMTRDGDFYKGMVTHFSTWNADYKLEDVTCITGRIADNNPDKLYFLTLVFPGYIQSDYFSDEEFLIIMLPQGTRMALQIRNTINGKTWFKSFVTNNSEDCYFTGVFEDNSYVPEVGGLFVESGDGTLTVSWQSEPENADHFIVKCSRMDNESDGYTFDERNISPGDKEAVIDNLPEGVIVVTVQTVLSDGRTSHGVQKYVKNSSLIMLAISLNSTPNFPVIFYYKLNDNSNYTLYENPLILPSNTHVSLLVEFESGDNGSYTASWEIYDQIYNDLTVDFDVYEAGGEAPGGGDLDVIVNVYQAE
ncbi:MAG: hypothetical protein JXR70_06945 [Spirochaetales bacterium]|nr:hypothetical protein [Spirochaetales bacterium]